MKAAEPIAVLRTERLLLRDMKMSDADALQAALGNPEDREMYGQPMDRQGVEDWIARNLERYAQFGYGMWAVVLKESGQVIGDCGLLRQEIPSADGTETAIEVSYHIHHEFRRRGYAAEAARACMAWAFGELGAGKVISLIRPANVASRRVAEKNGLKIVGQIKRTGGVHDIWQITREEWRRRKSDG